MPEHQLLAHLPADLLEIEPAPLFRNDGMERHLHQHVAQLLAHHGRVVGINGFQHLGREAQIDALLLQTPLPTSQISALNAQITALASTYTTQNALIASGETAVTNANARLAAAQQSMDVLNTRIAQINDAYAKYSKDGGQSAIVHTEANLKKAYVAPTALTKLYTNSYDIFDVSGLAYYSDGSGMYASNDCILYKAYFVNGALLFNG